MKIRTDFVTNSSSSGFVIINIKMENGEEIKLHRDYDTGYGGYFWNSSANSRSIMEHHISQLRNGDELLKLLRSNIDSFDTFVIGDTQDGKLFCDQVLNIKDFSDVRMVSVSENTSFDTGEEKSTEVVYEKKEASSTAAVKTSQYTDVEHIHLSMEVAQRDWTVKVGKSGVILSKYVGCAKNLTIPAYVDEKPVIEIKGPPAKNLPLITINIPDTVKTVDNKAFRGLKYISKVNIANKDTVISSGAFYGCAGLEDENGCIIVGGELHQCSKNGNVVISPGITRIPHRIAREEFPSLYTYKMVTLVIPEGVEVIEGEAFSGQNSLEVVVLPSTLKEIGDMAFSECSRLKNVILPEGVRKIGNFAFSCFYTDSGLESINFPSSLEFIGDGAFRDCEKLHATPPNHVKDIGVFAFKNCLGMADQAGFSIVKNVLYAYNGNTETVNVPAGVEYITDECFYWHKEIKSISLPSTLKQIGIAEPTCKSKVFEGCTGLADSAGFIIVGDCLWGYIGNAEEIRIPDGVKMVHSEAFCFSKDSSCKTVIVPSSVTHTGEHAFCNAMVIFEGDIPDTCESEMMVGIPESCYKDGFYIVGDTLISCKCDKNSLEIPAGVRRILPYALKIKDGTSVALPDSVEIMEFPQFSGYSTHATIAVPQKTIIKGYDRNRIVIKGFAGSQAESFVKKNAKHWEFVKIGEVVPDWKIKKLKDGTIQLVTYNCNDKEEVVIPSEIDGWPVAVLGKELFAGHHEIKKIHIPETVTAIEMCCFDKVGLQELHLPDSLKKIGMMAFDGCGLDVLEIPSSVEQLSGGAVRFIPTVIVYGNPKLIKNLDIFDHDAKIYAEPGTEVSAYVRTLPLSSWKKK